MAIVINGSGTVTGLAVGGLPDGTVDAGTLATNSVDSAELIDGSIDTAHIAANQITSAIMPTGSVLQVVRVESASDITTTNSAWTNIFGSSLSITAKASGSKYHFFATIGGCSNPAGGAAFGFRLSGSQTTQFCTHFNYNGAASGRMQFASTTVLSGTTTSGATSSYNVQVTNTNGGDTVAINNNGALSSLVIMEIAG